MARSAELKQEPVTPVIAAGDGCMLSRLTCRSGTRRHPLISMAAPQGWHEIAQPVSFFGTNSSLNRLLPVHMDSQSGHSLVGEVISVSLLNHILAFSRHVEPTQ